MDMMDLPMHRTPSCSHNMARCPVRRWYHHRGEAMSKAKKSKSARAPSKRAQTKTDWVGGIKQALAKKQTVQSWPGAGEAWKHKTKPH